MTTDAFTAAAFESAASKYQGDWDAFEQEPVDDYGLSESERRAHVAGWEAARDHLAQQEVTDAEVLAARDAVREVWRRQDGLGIGHVDLMEAELAAANPYKKEVAQ